MENIEYPKIKPEKITKPIQLLAVWFIGLIFIDGLFIYSATEIDNTVLEYFLVIASILNVPLFLFLLFNLQTKFRAELQEDSYYSKYLDKTTKKVEEKELDNRVEFRNEFEKKLFVLDEKIKNLSVKSNKDDISGEITQLKNGYQDILRMVTHEMKQLLTGINSSAHRMEYDLKNAKFNPERFMQIIDRIKSNVDISNITLENFNVQDKRYLDVQKNISVRKDLIYPVLKLLKPFAETKKVQFDIDNLPDTQFEGDKSSIQMALYNIIENALKYSIPSNKIRISSSIKDDFLLISIKNKTKGIKSDEIEKLFELGYRGENAKETDGLGLGLYTSHKIVKSHNGTIEINVNNSIVLTTIKLPINYEKNSLA